MHGEAKEIVKRRQLSWPVDLLEVAKQRVWRFSSNGLPLLVRLIVGLRQTFNYVDVYPLTVIPKN